MFVDVVSVEYFQKVPGISTVITATPGDVFMLILTNNGKVYGCGSTSVG